MKRVAISACLTGRRCRYDATDNHDRKLIGKLEGCELVPFCPEDHCFGSPRPTMDLIETDDGVKAISNLTGGDLTPPVIEYAERFFDENPDIDLFIGKDRSPSCGVESAKVYDRRKRLIDDRRAGLMATVAIERGIECYDAESYIEANPAPPITGS
jgi:uncharacterized protein YbbK (DUF523 family)